MTQIVVAITSDLTPKAELSRIEITLSKRDGSDVVAMQDYAIVGKSPKQGQQTLPVTFSITKGGDDSFLLAVTGYGPLGSNGAETKIVEQGAIATFQDGKTLLLQIFLGRVCLEKFCHDVGTQVCYSADTGEVKAGDCGQLLPLDLKPLDVHNLPDLAQLPKGVKRVDAGASDAAMDAKVTDTGTDAAVDGAAPNTGGTGGNGSGGMDGTSGSHSGTGGGVSSDPCAAAHGGCDPLVTCSARGSVATCGACPAGYNDTNGDGTACKDIDECATNNGGCGSATSFACVNNVGAAPTCSPVGDCSGTNVCTADYPCQVLGASYTCRGQFADWLPQDVPPAFTDNGDGTVTDPRNGLVWQQTISASGYPWLNAKTYCAGLSLAGTGWRLPTKAELESLIDTSRYLPAMDPIAFPNAPPEATWSSSPTPDTAGYAYNIGFNDGQSGVGGPLNGLRVRCVRSSPPVFASTGSGGAPPDRYTDNLNGTVLDKRTTLTWQQAVNANSYKQIDASSYCASLTLAGGGWRLPKFSELLTLVDPTGSAPAIDGIAFPNTPPENFWSSTPYAASAGVVWYVNFRTGTTTDDNTSVAYRVRCVR